MTNRLGTINKCFIHLAKISRTKKVEVIWTLNPRFPSWKSFFIEKRCILSDRNAPIRPSFVSTTIAEIFAQTGHQLCLVLRTFPSSSRLTLNWGIERFVSTGLSRFDLLTNEQSRLFCHVPGSHVLTYYFQLTNKLFLKPFATSVCEISASKKRVKIWKADLLRWISNPIMNTKQAFTPHSLC